MNTFRQLLFFITATVFCGQAVAQQFSVLMITKTDGWHHRSINAAIPALEKLAERNHFELTWASNPDLVINNESLSQYDVILFALTTGNILNEQQQAAVERFIQSGKGFVGIHSASDTEYDWPWYTQLVGKTFYIHPPVQTAQFTVEDASFPGMEYFPKRFWFTDEIYEFNDVKNRNLTYLLSVDENTYDPKVKWREKENRGNAFHPIAWYHEFDGGRSFYTALGHLPGIYEDELFLKHVYGGIFWAATGKGIKK